MRLNCHGAHQLLLQDHGEHLTDPHPVTLSYCLLSQSYLVCPPLSIESSS